MEPGIRLPTRRLPVSKAWALLVTLALLLTACHTRAEPVLDVRMPLNIGPGDLQQNPIGVYFYPEDDVLNPSTHILYASGARWARTWLDWQLIEPERTDPPSYHWAETDRKLRALRQAGYQIIFLLGGNADWASDSFCGPIYPRYQADFQRFVGDLVQRYQRPPYDIHMWEIYNEPDSVFGAQGYCFGTRGAQYADSLRLAYTAIKQADPQAEVLFGGISYDFFTNEGGRFDPAFLDDALAAGAGPYFDRLAFHYYPAFHKRWDAFGPGVAGKAAYLRSELARYGLDKPLALTELGRPTRGPAADGIPYNETLTARFVAPALTRARMADLAPIIWFTASDKPDEPYDYGLLDADLHPEPGLYALKAALPALQGGSYGGPYPVQAPAEAHLFHHGAQDAIIAWSAGDPVSLRLPVAEAWLVNIQAQSQHLAAASPPLQITIGQDPLILWFDAQQITHD